MLPAYLKHIAVGTAVLTVASFSWGQSPASAAAPPPDLDAYVASSMKTFDVPGMAVAIVKDGKIVVSKGYGVRKLGDPTRVDEFTMFGIGSNTKAFTTAALATLVDEGSSPGTIPSTRDFRLCHVRPLRLARWPSATCSPIAAAWDSAKAICSSGRTRPTRAKKSSTNCAHEARIQFPQPLRV